MRLIIEPNYEQLSKWAANYVAAKIGESNPGKTVCIGLANGLFPSGHVQEPD